MNWDKAQKITHYIPFAGKWKNMKKLLETADLPMVKTYDGYDARELKVNDCIGGSVTIHIKPIGATDDGDGYTARIYAPGSDTCAICSELVGYSCQPYYYWIHLAARAFSENDQHIIFCELNDDNELKVIQPWMSDVEIPITEIETGKRLIDPGDNVFACLLYDYLPGGKASARIISVIPRDVMRAMVYAGWYGLWCWRNVGQFILGHYLAIDRSEIHKRNLIGLDSICEMAYPKFVNEYKALPRSFHWPFNLKVHELIKDYYGLAFKPHEIGDTPAIIDGMRELIKKGDESRNEYELHSNSQTVGRGTE